MRLGEWISILLADASTRREEIDDVFSVTSEALYLDLYCQPFSDRVVKIILWPRKGTDGFAAVERVFVERFGGEYAGIGEILEDVHRETSRRYNSRLGASPQEVVSPTRLGGLTIVGNIGFLPGIPVTDVAVTLLL